MSKDKVSIIVPIYNVERYLNRCVDSLINQTYKNLEIILVNDGSPDNSPAICDRYAIKDTRIKVIHKENGGLSDARNAGINISTGKYIMFLDSDDYAELNMIENAVNTIETLDSDIVIWGYYAEFVDENERIINTINYSGLDGVLDSSDEQFMLSNELINLMGYAWNKLYKNEIIQKNNYRFKKGLSLVEDITFNSEVFKNHHSIAFVEEPLLHYMQRPRETLGGKFYENQFELKQQAMKKVYEMLLALGYNEVDITNTINKILFDTLKTIVRLLAQNNKENNKEKLAYISNLFSNNQVVLVLRKVHLDTFKDKVIKRMMISNKFTELMKLYSFRTTSYE